MTKPLLRIFNVKMSEIDKTMYSYEIKNSIIATNTRSRMIYYGLLDMGMLFINT